MKQSVHEKRPVRQLEVWLRQVGGENAVFDRETGAVHVLNDTAVAIWQLCDGETYPEEMIEAVCELSGMHRDIVREDIERILGEFESSGLVRWED